MASVGMIHLACYCGAQLIYLGEAPAGVSTDDVIETLKQRLGHSDFGVLTAADDLHGECPFCGLVYELPDPHFMKKLPSVRPNRIHSTLSRFRRNLLGPGELSTDTGNYGRYLN